MLLLLLINFILRHARPSLKVSVKNSDKPRGLDVNIFPGYIITKLINLKYTNKIQTNQNQNQSIFNSVDI